MLNYNEQQIHDDCMLSSLKHNYVEFVAEYGFAEADRKLERLFDNTWRRNSEIVWQWYGSIQYEYDADLLVLPILAVKELLSDEHLQKLEVILEK